VGTPNSLYAEHWWNAVPRRATWGNYIHLGAKRGDADGIGKVQPFEQSYTDVTRCWLCPRERWDQAAAASTEATGARKPIYLATQQKYGHTSYRSRWKPWSKVLPNQCWLSLRVAGHAFSSTCGPQKVHRICLDKHAWHHSWAPQAYFQHGTLWVQSGLQTSKQLAVDLKNYKVRLWAARSSWVHCCRPWQILRYKVYVELPSYSGRQHSWIKRWRHWNTASE